MFADRRTLSPRSRRDGAARAVARGRAAGAGGQRLRDVPRGAHRRAAGDAGDAVLGTDVHRERGFACVDCHGGDPSDGRQGARARRRRTGFKGKPTGQAQIAACARCHSDADADAHVRAEAARRSGGRVRHERARQAARRGRHATSRPAPAATARTAIRLVSDAKSPVYPTNVAATCATCHADPRAHGGLQAARRHRRCRPTSSPTTRRASTTRR